MLRRQIWHNGDGGDALQEDIYAATYHLLETEGYQGVTFARVARGAQTSRSVLYRYYDNVFDLVFETIMAQIQAVGDVLRADNLDQGNLRATLIYVGEQFAQQVSSAPQKYLRNLFSEMMQQRDQERVDRILDIATTNNRAIMDDVIVQALKRGELTHRPTADAQLVIFQLIRYHYMVGNRTLDTTELTHLVDHVILPAMRHYDTNED
ncbi:TetR/AcrR family transcriptional regulator [Lacticaseibacillus saniviri]|uniref:TetR/AcrR family transcriptional regulator n=1 Tax=Lacticaseibacillus saniviri TaxID=931533 RepID=UPI00138F7158|nr:TetR/AcrR family transcriptional regulator [Lacticaseibacillus saniviri]